MTRHRLEVRWNKREGLVADLSPRFDNASLRFILMEVFNDAVLKELESRGFDIATIRFRIDRTKADAAKKEAQLERSRGNP